jgi:hypothetical protein
LYEARQCEIEGNKDLFAEFGDEGPVKVFKMSLQDIILAYLMVNVARKTTLTEWLSGVLLRIVIKETGMTYILVMLCVKCIHLLLRNDAQLWKYVTENFSKVFKHTQMSEVRWVVNAAKEEDFLSFGFESLGKFECN